MIYLASPYSSDNSDVRLVRFYKACSAAARLMRKGMHVLSPIAHSHFIAECGGLPGDWKFWREFDLELLKACDSMTVLMLEGWRESKGVQAEIKIAEEMGMPVTYIES